MSPDIVPRPAGASPELDGQGLVQILMSERILRRIDPFRRVRSDSEALPPHAISERRRRQQAAVASVGGSRIAEKGERGGGLSALTHTRTH